MKRCPRCQAPYTDEVRWCPADGTPTEDVAPASIATPISETSATLHDLPVAAAAPNTLIGATSPLARPPAEPRVLPPALAKLVSSLPADPNATILGVASGPVGPTTLQGATALEVRAPSTVPGALIPPISSPLMTTFTGTTSEPPRTPHGSPTTPADLGPQGNTFMGTPSPVPRTPASPPSTVPGALLPPISAPLHNTFMGTTSEPPRTPHGSPVTPADLPTSSDPPAPVNATLQGFAPSPEVLRAIQEQRAKLAAAQAPAVAEEVPSASMTTGSAASYASLSVATPETATGAVNSTLPSLSPLPMQPAVVLMASQPASALSQAPLPSMSMPHAVPVVISPSLQMEASAPATTPKPPTASLLEGPAFQAAATPVAAPVRLASAAETDQHRAPASNRTLWIVFAVIAVAMAGGVIAILATR